MCTYKDAHASDRPWRRNIYTLQTISLDEHKTKNIGVIEIASVEKKLTKRTDEKLLKVRFDFRGNLILQLYKRYAAEGTAVLESL